MGRTLILVTVFFLVGGLAGLLVGLNLSSTDELQEAPAGTAKPGRGDTPDQPKMVPPDRGSPSAAGDGVRTVAGSPDVASELERLIASEPTPDVRGTGKITGFVRTPSGKPIPGVRVTAYANRPTPERLGNRQEASAGGDEDLPARLREVIREEKWRTASLRTAMTDAQGRYELAGLAPLLYRVRAQHPGYRLVTLPASLSKTVLPGDQLSFVGAFTIPVEVSVLSADGSAPPICELLIERKGGLRGRKWTPEHRHNSRGRSRRF